MEKRIIQTKDGKEIKMLGRMAKKIKISKWIIFTEFGVNAIPYILDSTKLDVSEEELCYCIQEQIYGDKNGI